MIRNRGMHEGEAYLSEETVRDMLTPAAKSRNTRCGLFARERDSEGRPTVVGHTGSSGTNCWIDFKHDLIGIMLTQTRGKDIKAFRVELEKRITACVAAQGD